MRERSRTSMSKYQRLAQSSDESTAVITQTILFPETTTPTATTAAAAPMRAQNATTANAVMRSATEPLTARENAPFSLLFAIDDDDDDNSDGHNRGALAANGIAGRGGESGRITNNNNHHNGNGRHYNNNNSNSNSNNVIIDADDSTMEVPLLNNNNSKNSDYDISTTHHRLETPCHCNQPGFHVLPGSKSAQEAKLKMLLAIGMCVVFMVVEFLGGYIAGSLAIVTDAAHLASDCITFVIGLLAIWLGGKPPDSRMSFGYKRMEVVGAIISILGIWILTAALVIVAVQRIFTNEFDLNANTMMSISGIGILINIAMIFILHGPALPGHGHSHGGGHGHSHGGGHGHSHGGHSHHDNHSADEESDHKHSANGAPMQREKNLNLRAALIHVIGDLVQSIGVFLAAVLIKIYPSAKFADPLCTLLFSVIVIMTTVPLFRESFNAIVDAVPRGMSIADLERDLSHIEGVKSVHHLNVWSHTTNHRVLMVHLVIDFLSDSNGVLQAATKLASSSPYEIKHSTIQIERLPL